MDMSIVNFGSAWGSILANSLVGIMVQDAGGKWNVVNIPLLLLAIAGLILSVVVHRIMAKKYSDKFVSPIEDFKQAI